MRRLAAMPLVLGLACSGGGLSDAELEARCEELQSDWREAVEGTRSCESSEECQYVGPTSCDDGTSIARSGRALNRALYEESGAAAIEREYEEAGCPVREGSPLRVPDYVGCVDGVCLAAAEQCCGICDSCNPITQQGCEASEKCSSIEIVAPTETDPDAPVLTRTACVDCGDGDRGCSTPVGEPCSTSSPIDGGADTCVRGAVCHAGACAEICWTDPDSCSAGTCQTVENLFDNIDRIGVCAGEDAPAASR